MYLLKSITNRILARHSKQMLLDCQMLPKVGLFRWWTSAVDRPFRRWQKVEFDGLLWTAQSHQSYNLFYVFWFKWSHSLEAFEDRFGVDLPWADQRRRCSVKEFANSTNTIQVAVEGCRSCVCFAAAHFRLTETAMDSIQISYYINDTFSDCSMFMAVFYRPNLGEIPEILTFIAHFNPD